MEILLIESNTGDIGLVKEAINETAIDCNLTCIIDGSEAVSYISEHGQSIDLLILSTNIIKVNAFDILDKVKRKSQLRDIPIYIFGEGEYRYNFLKANVLGATYCPKPTEVFEYFKNVKSFIETAMKHKK